MKKNKVQKSKKQKQGAKKQELILGVEDSGRGPVIGPLVMAGVMIPPEKEEFFRKIGVKDSKKLSARRREELAAIIKATAEFSITKIWPYEIDFGNHAGINLNKLEAIKAAQIINDMQPDVVIIDCPSPNTQKWQQEVEKRLQLQKKPKISCEHKADVKYPVVSAASIIAKVERDKEIEKIQQKIPLAIGSGYPADPITKKFLEDNWEKYRSIFRQTWQTWQRQKRGKEQKKLSEF